MIEIPTQNDQERIKDFEQIRLKDFCQCRFWRYLCSLLSVQISILSVGFSKTDGLIQATEEKHEGLIERKFHN